MTPSPVCTALIQSFEHCDLTAYKDAKGVLTIGWGHTGPDVSEGLRWSQAQADAAFLSDLQTAVNGVNAALQNGLSQNEFDALVSLTFNIGVGSFQGSTLVSLLKQGHHTDAAAEIPKWSHAGGVVSAGLLKRRCRECLLFLG